MTSVELCEINRKKIGFMFNSSTVLYDEVLKYLLVHVAATCSVLNFVILCLFLDEFMVDVTTM